MMVYSVGNITECVELGRNEARLVAQGLRLVHCDLSGLLEAEGPEDRAVPDQDLVPVTAGLEAHDGASESLAELCEGDHVSVLLLGRGRRVAWRSEEHPSELQSLMRISYDVFCLKQKLSNIS